MNNILIGKSGDKGCYLVPKMVNRHGLIAGATGTGKTITLRTITEGLSKIGVPVFLADMKGDLSGISKAGSDKSFKDRAYDMGVTDFKFEGFPCKYWDIYRDNGVEIKAPVREVGSFLLSRVLGLTKVQCGVLDLVFAIAKDKQFRLDTLSDVKDILKYMMEFDEELFTEYGTFYPSTLGAILRAVINIEQQGGSLFFDTSCFELQDMVQTDNGRGVVNILDCTRLVQEPLMYSTFILWILDKLYTELPEVGDCDKPKFVLFFDEAHLLFEDTSKAVVSKVAQIVRLIRSKGVGVYFISQSPSDIPDRVLSQLSNRVQHSLRAFTPDEMRAVKVAAKSFRPNPNFDTEDCIMELGVGEALVSFLDEKGIPMMVQRAFMLPPCSDLNILNSEQRKEYNRKNGKNKLKTHQNTATYKSIPHKQKQAEKRQQNGSDNVGQIRNTYYERNTRPSMTGAVVGGILNGLLGKW